MHPPPTKPIQLRDEKRPCGEASPSEMFTHWKMNKATMDIILDLFRVITCVLTLGTAYMMFETKKLEHRIAKEKERSRAMKRHHFWPW